jgi:hypothetical protein
MRSTSWSRELSDELRQVWPEELFLLAAIMPDRAARDAWTLFGGYPYAEALGYARPASSVGRSAVRGTICG